MGPAVATDFTPVASLAGGVLIGLSAVLVMAVFGAIAGISGLARATLGLAAGQGGDPWRAAFVAGLVAAPLAVWAVGGTIAQTVPSNLAGMAVAGLVVGFGAAMGSGCTSGHGVCGLARLSPRSLAAVLTFMATAAATVFVLRHGLA